MTTKEQWKNKKTQQKPELPGHTVFSDRLCHIMEDTQTSTKELAEKIYVTAPSITGYRRARRTPDLEKLSLIADALSTSTDYLLGRTDSVHPIPEGLSQKQYQALSLLLSLPSEDLDIAIQLISSLKSSSD